MAATSVCFELNRFDSVCPLNYQYQVMYSDYPDHTQQLVYQLCFDIFSELFGISQCIAICIVSWCVVSWSPCQYSALVTSKSRVKPKVPNFEFWVLNKSLTLFQSHKITQMVNACKGFHVLLTVSLRQEDNVTHFFTDCSLTWLDFCPMLQTKWVFEEKVSTW